MTGRRVEDQAGTCLRCGATLHRCPCGRAWSPCGSCGYPPKSVTTDAMVPGDGPGGIERRRCHCDDDGLVDWMDKFTKQRDSLLIKASDKRKRRDGEQE